MPKKHKKTKLEETREFIDHWDKEGRSITQELGRVKAEGLRDSYNSYTKAGFTPEDAMRLLLQDALLAASGDRPIVQGLSFSDLLRHQHTPTNID